jgi:hypothetical protein
MHPHAHRAVATLLAAVVLAGCAGPRASVMAMRDIPADQQERDRGACESEAGAADVTRPATGTLVGAVVGALTGVGVGVGLALKGNVSSDDASVGLYFLVAAAGGAAVGALTGAVVGWSSGVNAAHDEYFARYTACMRERGYSVIREPR